MAFSKWYNPPVNVGKQWGNAAGIFVNSSEQKTCIINFKKKKKNSVLTCTNKSERRRKVSPEILPTGKKNKA